MYVILRKNLGLSEVRKVCRRGLGAMLYLMMAPASENSTERTPVRTQTHPERE